MSVYLHDIPLDKAQQRMRSALEDAGLWRVLGDESIPLDENALGRVLAAPVWALTSSPHYHAAAMDGFAVRAEATAGAMPTAPLTLSAFKYVDTGDPLPADFNAVIPIENVESLDANGALTSDLRGPAAIRIRAAVTPWSHVRPLGEDIVATQLVLPAGHVLRPYDLGAIAASGHTTVRVARRPKVAILPTGTELVPMGTALEPGDILEYNSLVMAAQIKEMGGEATRFPITADDFAAILERVREAAREHDLVLLNAGSSAGAEDFSAGVVEALGTLLVHGVAVRPGHPVIFGVIARDETTKPSPVTGETASGKIAPRNDMIPIVGVPGYPVSAALTVDIFVEPLIARWLGRPPRILPVMEASLTRKITSPGGDDDFVRVAVGRVGEKVLAAPLSRGAGVITSLVRADGLMLLPHGQQGAEAGQRVEVRMFRSREEVERTIFAIGSHDMTLDLLAQFLAEHDRRLVSANVGSLGGLVALKRGEAHLAGSHLLDPETGEYNLSYIRQYLAGEPVSLYAFVEREQGLIVPKDNPKKITGLEHLVREDVTFVNRQRGAGTRVLLDYHLNRLGIAPEQISGYNQEEYTHLGVAAAVASGRADCGLGIPAAAQALDLGFVPLFDEEYQLVIPKRYADGELLGPFFEVIASRSFQAAVAEMPGYGVDRMGQLIAEV